MTYLSHCYINSQQKLLEVQVVVSVKVKDTEQMACYRCCISCRRKKQKRCSSRDPVKSFLPPGKAFSNSFFILCRLIFPLGHSMRNLKLIEITVYFFLTSWTMPGSVFPQIEFCLHKTEHQRAWDRIPLVGTLMSPEKYFDVTWKSSDGWKC